MEKLNKLEQYHKKNKGESMNNLFHLSLEHIYMVAISVFIACIIAVPSAIIFYKKKFFVQTSLYIVSLMQSFPALGFFALIVPFLGIGMKVVILALIMYALLPIYQGTITAMKNINPEYYEIIEALNLKKSKVFWKIEFPLILPQIINSIRLALTYSIAFATMGTLVGAGGLGDLIYEGLQSFNIMITLQGLIPLLTLTIITNYLFSKLEKLYYTPDYKQLIKKEGK